MKLKNYVLYTPDRVIGDDRRDPWVSWQHHLERTNPPRGGVDCVADIGTPIFAPTLGQVNWVRDNGGAGNQIEFAHSENKGWSDIFSHLGTDGNTDGFAVPDGTVVKQGTLIGYTGNSGGVDPHLHRHLLDPYDTRKNPWDYFTNVGSLQHEQENDMEPVILQTSSAGAKYLYNPNTKTKRSINSLEWSIMRKAEAAGAKLIVVTVTADEINSIPGK